MKEKLEKQDTQGLYSVLWTMPCFGRLSWQQCVQWARVGEEADVCPGGEPREGRGGEHGSFGGGAMAWG